MPELVPIVEGDGEVDAGALLLRRLLWEDLNYFHLKVVAPWNAHGRGNMTKPDGIENLLQAVLKTRDLTAVLVLLDADDDAPCVLACDLRRRIEAIRPQVPVAVVCANIEYESWFVDSIETVRGACGIAKDAQWPEARPANPKAWLRSHMPPDRTYKEKIDQPALTSRLDFALLEERSRSFRRMRHAVEELVEAWEAGVAVVTPLNCPQD